MEGWRDAGESWVRDEGGFWTRWMVDCAPGVEFADRVALRDLETRQQAVPPFRFGAYIEIS